MCPECYCYDYTVLAIGVPTDTVLFACNCCGHQFTSHDAVMEAQMECLICNVGVLVYDETTHMYYCSHCDEYS